MKKIQKLLAFVLATTLLFSLIGCGQNSNQDETAGIPEEYQEIIDDFADGDDMEETLMVGEEHRAWGSVHLTNGPSWFYETFSSDKNVVTVSSKGKVTAIGEGVAYVIIAQKLPILGVVDYDCTKYTVYADQTQMRIDTGTLPNFGAIVEAFFPDSFNCVTLTAGESHTPAESMWLMSGMGGVYTSNESVVTVSEGGTVTAVGEGVAYVVIAGGANVYKVYQYTVELP